MGGYVVVWVVSCQITRNQINLHLVEIIQFCLKIYDLYFKHLKVNGYVIVIIIGQMS